MHNINKKVDKYLKHCEAVAAGAVIGVASLLMPFITMIVDKVREGDNLKQDLQDVIKNLNEYKKEYTFGKYDVQFTSFLKHCQDLLNLLDGLDPDNKDILKNLELYMQVSSKVEEMGYACKGYLDEMKNFAGKTFDVVKMFGGGLNTLTTASEKAIDSLYKHLSMERPKITSMYATLVNKAKEAIVKEDIDNEFETDSGIKSEFDDFANINF